MAGNMAFSINFVALNALFKEALGEDNQKQRLIDAGTMLVSEARGRCGTDKYQLRPSIHIVEPGQTDSSWSVTDSEGTTFDNSTGQTAKENEVLVVARTHRGPGTTARDRGDYALYHNSKGRSPSFYMTLAANKVRGAFPDLDISEPRPI